MVSACAMRISGVSFPGPREGTRRNHYNHNLKIQAVVDGLIDDKAPNLSGLWLPAGQGDRISLVKKSYTTFPSDASKKSAREICSARHATGGE